MGVPSRRATLAILGLCWLLALAVSAVFVFNAAFDADEFIFAADARRVSEGALQGRDFFQYVMPGTFLLTGLAFKWLGPSVVVGRAVMALLLAAASVAYGWLARRLGASRVLAVMMGATVLIITGGRHFGHRWFAQSMLAFTLVAAWHALGRETPRAWGLVGLGAGLTYAMHQLDGAGLMGALALALVWLGWRERAPLGKTAARAGWLLAGWGLPLVALALYYGLQGGLAEFWWATHVWPVSQYAQAGNHNDVAWATDLGWRIAPDHWLSRPHFYSQLLLYVTYALLPVAATLTGLAWLVGLGRTPQPSARTTGFLGLLVMVSTMALLATLRGRADLAHMMASATPHFLLATAAIAGWEATPRTAGARGLNGLPRLALAGLLLCAVVLHVERERHTMAAPLRLASPDAIRSHPTMRALAAQLSPGDTVLAAAHGAMYNLYLAPSPTRYHYWVRPEDGYTLPAQFAEILRDVETRRPRFLLVPATTRLRADATIKEMLTTYTYQQTLPHVQPGWRGDWQLYVYRPKERP